MGDVFTSTSSKSDCSDVIKNCGEDSVEILKTGTNNDMYCDINAMTYLACSDKIDGTLGERKYIQKLKQKHMRSAKSSIPYMPEYVVDLLKKMSITLSDWGFSNHFKNGDNAKQYSIDMFHKISQELKKNKNDFEIIKKILTGDKLKVKLNPIILREIINN